MRDNFTDSQILDFIDVHEPSIHKDTYFTVLTQHISKEHCKNIREFCSFALNLQKMLNENNISIMDWHSMLPEMQHTISEIWNRENRKLTSVELEVIKEELNQYWESIASNEN